MRTSYEDTCLIIPYVSMADWLLRMAPNVDMVKRPRYNKHVAKLKKRERTMLNAVCLALVATLVAAVVPFTTLALIPNTVVWHMIGVYTSTATLSPQSELYQSWESQMDVQDAYLTAFAMLVGGLTLGLLAPSRLTLINRAIAAAKMCIGTVCAAFLFSWTAQLVSTHFKVAPYMFPLRLILVQAGLFIGWTAIGAVGGYVGGRIRLWRNGDRNRSQPQPA